ncbi:MAG: hypothetical protein C0501_30360, partial [Isosphaera sp.]|nr:hypothetical protein [Isosphaera sp.]
MNDKDLDAAVERLDRLVDLSVISNTLAAASGQLLARAVSAAPPAPAPVPVPVPPAPRAGPAAAPPPGNPPLPPLGVPPYPAPAPPAPRGGPAPTPPAPGAPPRTRAGRLWDAVKRTRVGRALGGAVDRTRRWRDAGRATGVRG